jgi:hypothetical protein
VTDIPECCFVLDEQAFRWENGVMVGLNDIQQPADGLHDGDSLADGDDPQCAASPSCWDDERTAKPQPRCGLGYALAPLLLLLYRLRS